MSQPRHYWKDRETTGETHHPTEGYAVSWASQPGATFSPKKRNFFGLDDLDFLADFAEGAFFARFEPALASGTMLKAKVVMSNKPSKRRIKFLRIE
jgi:hypothetical protein